VVLSLDEGLLESIDDSISVEINREKQNKKFILVQNIHRLEKDMKKVQKQVRRLQPKVSKAARNYNRILKEVEKGNKIVEVMEKKRNELLIEFEGMNKV